MKRFAIFLSLVVCLAAVAVAQQCPAGSKFSDSLHRCVKIGGPEDPPAIPCPPGFALKYDKTWTCVVGKPADPAAWIPVNGAYWDNLYLWLTGPQGVAWYVKQLDGVDVTCTREKHTLLWGVDRNTGLNYYETFDCSQLPVVTASFFTRFSFGSTPIAAPPQLYRISNGNPYRAAEFLAFWLGVGSRPKE